MDKYVQLTDRMPRMSESRALRVLAGTPLILDFSDTPLERHTPLMLNAWLTETREVYDWRQREIDNEEMRWQDDGGVS